MTAGRPRVGVAGLGRMGSAAAARLLECGFAVAVWNRTPERTGQLVEAGAKPCATPAELAASSDVVLLWLTDAAAVTSVTGGPDGLLAAAGHDLLVVDMSTVAPEASRQLAAAGAARGIAVLDAPVAGGPPLLRKGQAGVMVGGEEAALERARPVLEALGRMVVHAGGNGQGSALKLVNNLVLAISIEATAEALVLVERLDLDPRHLFEISTAGGAQTRAMEVRGPRMIARDFVPGGSVDDLRKDLAAALAMAAANGVDAPAASAVLGTLDRARDMGWGASDSSSIFAALLGLAPPPPD